METCGSRLNHALVPAHRSRDDLAAKRESSINVEYAGDDAPPNVFLLIVEGDSMLPTFRDGDRVRIDPEVAPNPGDFVVACTGKNEATFKKYRVRGIDASGEEIFELVPLNADYASVRSDETRMTILGTMTEHRRKYRSTK